MKSPNSHKQAAFSLVEMLSVIAVIGIISAIAVPGVSRINDSAREATAKRNAQNIASIYASAQAAGLSFNVGNGDVLQTIQQVIAGGTASGGVFDGAYFGLPGLSESEQLACLPYLSFQGTSLIYQSGSGALGTGGGGGLENGLSTLDPLGAGSGPGSGPAGNISDHMPDDDDISLEDENDWLAPLDADVGPPQDDIPSFPTP